MNKLKNFIKFFLFFALLNQISSSKTKNDEQGLYNMGVGRADVTGPLGVGMMGYVSLGQTAQGIHTRLYSRAFIFESVEATEDSPNGRVVFISVDIGMIDSAIKFEVSRILKEKYGNKYSEKNVLISATHTHSGPAGYLQYAMHGIASGGFVKNNFDGIVNGIIKSIERAQSNMVNGKAFFSTGELLEANMNRSPWAYEQNPQEEQDQYAYDVDKDMHFLSVETDEETPRELGSINWFPVHPVSMNSTNRLISGDNKGLASLLLEHDLDPNSANGASTYVAAFAASNLGDSSPNINGSRCIDTGLECDYETSTCNGYTQLCRASGPGDTYLESTQMIAERHFEKAKELLEDKENRNTLTGAIQFAHQFIDMTNYPVTVGGQTIHTCKSALGFSFAGGTVDGPGLFDFSQGNVDGNPFWEAVRDFIKKPTDELVACHGAKPILLPVGEIELPYPWAPTIVDTQVIKIGNLFIIGFPGEVSTMGGRRIVKTIKETIGDRVQNPQVIIAGLSNIYTHYVVTPEEYRVQRYEGASTLYGPYTLLAYIDIFNKQVEAILTGNESALPPGPDPPNFLHQQLVLQTPVSDTRPFMREFGEVLRQPMPLLTHGEMVKAVFVGGHPRNNPNSNREGTYFVIEKKNEADGTWEVIRTDADPDADFKWRLAFPLSTVSQAEVRWEIPEDLGARATLRVRHFGYFKQVGSTYVRNYQGTTDEFYVGSYPLAVNMEEQRKEEPEKNLILTVSDFWRELTKRA